MYRRLNFVDNVLLCRDSVNKGFASGGADKTVYVWDIETTKITRRLRSHADVCNNCLIIFIFIKRR
jgi:WD40 repeat protein